MRRSLYVMLMMVLVLRGLAGTAMAAGLLPPLVAPGAQHAQLQHSEHHPHDVRTAALSTALVASYFAATAASEATAGQYDATTSTPSADAPTPQDGHPHDHWAEASEPPHAEHAACDPSTASCAAHDHHSAACSACDICHSAMLDTPAVFTPGHASAGAVLPLTAAQFDSAPAALAIKPPIS